MRKQLLSFFLFLFTCVAANAAEHFINFGGAQGSMYAPANLTVLLNDVVTWQGTFSSHPLSSTSVPTGAATFSNTSGTTFSYTATEAGIYTYQCDFHAAGGMVGTFTVVDPTLVKPLFPVNKEVTVYPSVTSGQLTIDLNNLPVSKHITIELFNVSGQKVYSKTSNGAAIETLDIASMDNGIYLIAIKSDDNVVLIKRIVKN